MPIVLSLLILILLPAGAIADGHTSSMQTIQVAVYPVLHTDFSKLIVSIEPENEKPGKRVVLQRVGGKESSSFDLFTTEGEVQLLTALDLVNAPKTINLKLSLPATTLDFQSLTSPALLFKIIYANKQDLVLVGLTPSIKTLWKETITQKSVKTPNRPGSTPGFETVEMRFEKGDKPLMDIVLLQAALPSKEDTDQIPGPPLTLLYQFENDTYIKK